MKKLLLFAALGLSVGSASAQVVYDTVSVGAPAGSVTYPNQVWYSLRNDEQKTEIKNDWDLAFDVSSFGAAVMINSVSGTTLWKYPKNDTAGWNNVDTTGMGSWTAHYNSDTSWALGAMGRYANAANQLDLDWGKYDINTHIITGDSLFIVKLGNGSYKKLQILSLNNGVYSFRYADLNGSNLQQASLTKSNYTGKNFGYYSLQNNTALDREPLSAKWDLLFTQYTTFIPIAYTVTGVLHNTGVHVAEVGGLSDVATNVNYSSQVFGSAINIIGYDWKSFTGTAYVTKDSLLYFVKAKDSAIWKVVFTGFGGSTTGNYMFSKQRLTGATGISNTAAGTKTTVALYPNPSNGSNVKVVYDFENNVTAAAVKVYDLSGKLVHTAVLDKQQGLHYYQLPAMTTGFYIVSVEADGAHMQQKLVVQ